MKKLRQPLLAVSALALVHGALLVGAPAQAEEAKVMSATEEAKAIIFDNKKGNCLACHQIEGGESPGNIGPPLIHMQARFNGDKALLRQRVEDATLVNPNTVMPPFGKHGILSPDEITKVVDFIYNL